MPLFFINFRTERNQKNIKFEFQIFWETICLIFKNWRYGKKIGVKIKNLYLFIRSIEKYSKKSVYICIYFINVDFGKNVLK